MSYPTLAEIDSPFAASHPDYALELEFAPAADYGRGFWHAKIVDAKGFILATADSKDQGAAARAAIAKLLAKG